MIGSADGGATPSVNPFVGPRPIEAGERLWGRDREIRELDDELSSQRVVLLCSPSGAGKSSLIRAGLVPRLAASFDIWGPTRVHLPTSVGTANRYVASALAGFEAAVPKRLRRGPESLADQTLLQYVEGRPRRRRASSNILLIFDQFEEVLTADPLAIAAKEAFFDQLGEALRNPRIWALFALREDYLVALDPYAHRVPTQFEYRYRLDLLGHAAARAAMNGPAADAGREFRAAEHLVRDLATRRIQQLDGTFAEQVGPDVEPVQLQVVCRRLWDALPADRTSIEVDDLEQFGDVGEALAGYYDDAVEQVAAGDVSAVRGIRDWFGERLITAGGLRGQVLREPGASGGLDNGSIEALLDSHLIRAEQRAGATWYELAHDRLIEPVLASNLAWRREHLAEVQHQARLWDRQGRPDSLLWLDEALRDAEAWVAEHRPTAIEQAFLDASRKAQRIAVRERRQRRLVWWGAIVATSFAILATILWRISEGRREMAENLTRTAVGVHLLSSGQTADGNLLLLEVERPEQTETAVAALHAALAEPVELVTLEGHASDVRDAVWSHDGRRILTVSWDTTVRIWSATTGATERELAGHSGDLMDAAWSPDDQWIATGGYGADLRVWDATTGDLVHEIAVGSAVIDVSWSPDGRHLAVATVRGEALILDAESGDRVTVARAHEAMVDASDGGEFQTIRWSPEGQRVASQLDASAFIWDPTSGGTLVRLDAHADDILDLAWSPDGALLATASADGTARVWDASTGTVTAVLEGHNGWVSSVAWSPTGDDLATASHDQTARQWRRSGELVSRFDGHRDALVSIAWSPDGAWLATASDDQTARLWRAGISSSVARFAGHSGQIYAASWGPAGHRVLTTSSDGTARIWSATDFGEALHVFRGHGDEVYSVAWSPDGRQAVTASWDGTARVWDPAEAREAVRLAGHEDGIWASVWSPDSRQIATASWDHTARLWDAVTGDALHVLEGHVATVRGIAWSPDGRRVATASDDRTAKVWGGQDGALLQDLSHGGTVVSVDWSADSRRLLTASTDQVATIWTVGDETAEPASTQLTGHDALLTGAWWSPDDRQVLTTSYDKTARLWDGATGDLLTVLEGHSGDVVVGAWRPDGARVATGSLDATTRVWEADSGDPVWVLEHPPGDLASIAWNRTGTRLAVTAWNGAVEVWDADSGRLVSSLVGHHEAVSMAAWSVDGDRLLTASNDATMRLWAISDDYSDYLRGRIRSRTDRCLPLAFYPQRLGMSEAEAERRHAACLRCVPRFHEVLGERSPGQRSPSVYEASWRAYEACRADR
ncbi:MAG: hypothetical protein AAGE94_02695 [Acidobacteriota bacterium]